MSNLYKPKINVDFNNPYERRRWFNQKIFKFMYHKLQPEIRWEFYDRLMANKIPYKEKEKIIKLMRMEENEKKEKYKNKTSERSFSPKSIYDIIKKPK
jgi:hypothetical protein